MSEFIKAPRQPISSDVLIADEVWAKPFRVPDAHTFLPQHSHSYGHVSVIVRGSVRVACEGMIIGSIKAPGAIVIEAKKKHMFETLEDDTIILCCHNIRDGETIEIHEENHIQGVG